jgi:hypothetical protein
LAPSPLSLHLADQLYNLYIIQVLHREKTKKEVRKELSQLMGGGELKPGKTKGKSMEQLPI